MRLLIGDTDKERQILKKLHSDVGHRLNYGIGVSLFLKLEQANWPVAEGGHVAKAIHHKHSTTTSLLQTN